jgi:hypothetical protein
MPLKSDITFDTSKLDSNAISPETTALNESLMELGRKGPKWYEVRSYTEPCSSYSAANDRTGGRRKVSSDAMERGNSYA